MGHDKGEQDVVQQIVDFYALESQLYRLLLKLTEVQLEALNARSTPAI